MKNITDDEILKISSAIADLANIFQNTDRFKTSHIELCYLFHDYEDGRGLQGTYRAQLHDVTNDACLFYSDSMESYQDALSTLHKYLQEKVKPAFDLKSKTKDRILN